MALFVLAATLAQTATPQTAAALRVMQKFMGESMSRILLMFLLTAFAVPGLAQTLTFSKGTKSKDEYKSHKCVDGVFAVRALKAELTSDEICKYGKEGCSSINVTDKMTVYCQFGKLSECFEQKSWLSIDQILGVKIKEEPGLITYGLKKGSTHEGKTCAFWD